MNISTLDDKTLLAQTKVQAARERKETTVMLHYLREVYRRRLYSDLHYSSMFDFCLKELNWSEGQTSRRISAARLVESKPSVGKMIENGEMSLGVAAELSRFIKKEKPDEKTQNRLIEQVKGKSRRETDLIISKEAKEPAKLKIESLRRADTKTQRLSLNVSDELFQKLERLRGLLGHKNVSTYENLLEVVTNELLKRLDPEEKVVKEKAKRTTTFAANVKRRKAIPVKVRRDIWGNAKGKCEKCGGTHALEVDHRLPLAKFGSDDPKNLRLLCRSCNQREAIIKIGRRQMSLFLD